MSESDYILGQAIARGGMAEVYRGLHVGQDGFKRVVAIKRILPKFASNQEFSEMFRDEAHIGQRLQHANIARVECYQVIDNVPCLVMEYVDGCDVRSLLAEIEKHPQIQKLPIAITLYIVAEAARGLHYAHTRMDDVTGKPLELVHRDISPQNILLSFQGEVKVTDFGIAAVDSDFKNTETRAGVVKGKYAYMSPEQITAKKVDPRTDVFALGIVLWECLAMKRLFSADNEIDVINMVRDAKLPGSIREINREVTSELESIVLKSLSKDVKMRFPTMEIFERTLRSYLSKYYPQFSVSDIVELLNGIMKSRQASNSAEIKKLLTNTNLRAAGKGPSGASIELEHNATSQPNINLTVAKNLPSSTSTGHQRALHSRMPGSIAIQASSTAKMAGSAGTKNKHKRSNFDLKWALALVLIVASFGGIYKYRLQSVTGQNSVTLRSTPESVRAKVNGKSINGGRYFKTPVRIRLEPGTNVLEIIRIGYANELVTLNTQQGTETPPLNVKLKANTSFIPVQFQFQGTTPATVVSSGNYLQLQFTKENQIFKFSDLVPRTKLDFRVTDGTGKTYTCEVNLRSSTGRIQTVKFNSSLSSCD
jgi:serine/threonine protein kinase